MKWLAGAALALLINVPLHADQGIIPLGQLAARAGTILIGHVTATRQVDGGTYLMSVAVEQTLKGTPQESVQIVASSVDPTDVRPLSAGMRILTFLDARTLQPVAGEHGVQTLSGDDAVRVVSAIVRTELAKGADLQLRDVTPYFTARETPPVLLASLLEELSAHVTPSADGEQLARFACDGSVMPAVQLWAIGESGQLQVAAARPCLESLVKDPSNRATRIAATTALGDLRMSESVPVLLTLIAPLPGQQISARGDEDLPEVRPASDPEDDSSPVADPDERGGQATVDDERPGTPSTLPDGDVEPDSVPTDDAQSRRSDAGLSDAAVLALGKIGDPAAVRDLFRVASEGDDLSLHSTVVVALGMIGGDSVVDPLSSISRTHPNELVRELASQTLARLQANR
ncbi:MAG: HEAT repeat domain-containing protein [Acidobacteria bacterium]|nr:HEAT repeat domain-containing protein [Acidobacteriota bacterium]MBV9476806.1 HEAT repeat domain-containing protein [Acidobacteriota bacterium]